VPEVWFIDPKAKTVEVLTLHGRSTLSKQPTQATTCSPPISFPAGSFPLTIYSIIADASETTSEALRQTFDGGLIGDHVINRFPLGRKFRLRTANISADNEQLVRSAGPMAVTLLAYRRRTVSPAKSRRERQWAANT